ncbi:PLP-dependent aminotransferase family protein [Pseudoxanthomonas putridarboris]|uniref:PLP-dependent aminotransferase family protein n=1 Tax=Pseudoxanthomonas putridarboris TaxID=752605 RepID=A0ABU9J5U1_9GAMM
MNRSIAPDRLAALVGDFNRSPAYRGLRQALQELIGDGRIPIGTRLPSERAVTEALGVSRNTVTRAYADLIAAGFATARQGSGTYAAAPIDRRRAHDHALHSLGAAQSPEGAIDLNCAAGAATPGVAAAYERALAALPAYLASDGYLPSGLPGLQALIAESYARRGLPTAPEQIVITSGALSGIAIIARAFSRPGDRVMIESPVYSNAIEALRLGGGRLVTSPLGDALGEEGWDVDGIEATLRQTSPHLAYLIPDFQNPTGFLMSDAVRARYARALRAARTIAIVDETLQPTRLSDDPMPAPFAVHAPDAVTVGSTSKMYWGGLRVGWIRAPRQLVGRIVAARVRIDLGSSLFDQLVVAELLVTDDILAARREQLRQRRDALARALGEHLPGWRFRLPGGGLTLWVQMPHGSATRLAADVERAGVYLAPGPVFSVEGGSDSWLRIPYAKPEEELVEAVRHIADALPADPFESRNRRETSRFLIA